MVDRNWNKWYVIEVDEGETIKDKFCIPLPLVWSKDGPVLWDEVLPVCRVQSNLSLLSWAKPQIDGSSKLHWTAEKLKRMIIITWGHAFFFFAPRLLLTRFYCMHSKLFFLFIIIIILIIKLFKNNGAISLSVCHSTHMLCNLLLFALHFTVCFAVYVPDI